MCLALVLLCIGMNIDVYEGGGFAAATLSSPGLMGPMLFYTRETAITIDGVLGDTL